jgi:poly-beta-hydroxyalkanoate depolymerase
MQYYYINVLLIPAVSANAFLKVYSGFLELESEEASGFVQLLSARHCFSYLYIRRIRSENDAFSAAKYRHNFYNR